jgi:hypothetical protein
MSRHPFPLVNGATCGSFLRWCSPLTLVGRLHHRPHMPAQTRAEIRPTQRQWLRTTLWGGVMNYSSTSLTSLTALSTVRRRLRHRTCPATVGSSIAAHRQTNPCHRID